MSRLLPIIFLMFFSIAAEAAMVPDRQKLFVAGRYAELEVLMEKEIGNDPNPKSAKLMFQCAAFSKLKRYNRLFPCLAKLSDNVKNGDVAMNDVEEMMRDSPFLGGLAKMGAGMAGGQKNLEGTVAPFVHLMYAEAYNELRDYPKAIAAAKAAYNAIPPGLSYERSISIMTLTSLGLAEGFGGHKQEAMKIAQQLSEISTSYPHTLLAKDKWLGVARIYISVGEFRKANEALNEDTSSLLGSLAVGLADAIAGLDAGDSMFSYIELPTEFLRYKTRYEIGEVKEVKEGFDKLLKDKRTQSNGEIYWLLLYDRGRIAADESNLTEAVQYWTEAVNLIEQQRSTISTEANKIGFVGDKQAVYHHLIDALFSLQRYDEAFDYLERSKSRALVDMLASKKDFAIASEDEAKVQKLLNDADRAEIDALAQAPVSVQQQPVAEGKPKNQRSLSVQPAMKALTEAAPELASLVTVTSISVKDIQQRLAENEALVEYYYDEKASYAFVLTRQTLQGVRLDSANIETDVRALRDAIEKTETNAWMVPAQKLYGKLVKPIESMIGGKARLIVVAHGALHYLPFAALHDGSQFLLDKVSLRFLPSASVVKYLRTGDVSHPGGVLAIGNPDLNDPRLDLNFAQEEAQAITRMVPRSRSFLRKEANESAVRQYGQGFRYLHFATHGEFKADSPLESALILSKDGQGDGRLSVSKLYSMHLNADLVTLSACETGLGEIASGDDVVGLTRGFLYAGASSIVASLWKVDDQATSDLMRAFYLNLSKMGKLDALRGAQLETKAKYSHPFFWAAFQLLGSPDGGQYVAIKAAEPPPPVAKSAKSNAKSKSGGKRKK